MELEGIGVFEKRDGYWESSPIQMNGSLLSIESEEISNTQIKIAKEICSSWEAYLNQCNEFIESSRSEYGLLAKEFSNPNVFINTDNEWAVYFDSENEMESVVGVEFKDNSPFQLVIGD